MSTSTPFDCSGRTTNGDKYGTIADMWREELGTEEKVEDPDTAKTWYAKSEAYWAEQKASIEGMLGGLDSLHSRDVAASKRFFEAIPNPPCRRYVLDVGAGIGRVSKHLLLPLFDNVDMLEQSLDYVKESQSYLSDVSGGVIGRRIVCGMQEFRATGVTGRDGIKSGSLVETYDVVWLQWCVIYCTDIDLVGFLQECVKTLTENGLIVIKDNVARSGFLVDKSDSSVMRSDRYMKALFQRADLEVVKQARQLDFPKDVYPVRMYALRPITSE